MGLQMTALAERVPPAYVQLADHERLPLIVDVLVVDSE
jgi:hypothetical protein